LINAQIPLNIIIRLFISIKMHYNSSVIWIVLLGLASALKVDTAATSTVEVHIENKLNLEAHEATKM
jgi:hypothetical protein